MCVCVCVLCVCAAQINTGADVCMDLLVDKLKLLDYERDFCRKK